MKKQALFEEFNYFCSTAILPARKAIKFSISSFNILAINRHKPKSVIIKTGVFLSLLILIILGSSCNNSEPEGKELPRVYIKEIKGKYQLIRNGEPFYIKGAAGNAYLEELKLAGGNALRLYDTVGLQKILDKAGELDIAVVVDIPLPSFSEDPEFYEDQEKFDGITERVTWLVQRYKDHPALLYWTLGNEIRYPFFYKRTKFFKNYNHLIDLVHNLDPNHPVTTSIAGSNRRRLNSIFMRSPQLDFISLNIFGGLTTLTENRESLILLWKGPYVISEWGVNGPWEEGEIIWKAPIEPTSTKKAEIVKERHNSKAMQDPSSLGSFFFFWGQKQESTPTWFSVFSKEGDKSQVYYQLSRLWGNNNLKFYGPKINYALLNGKGAPQGIILAPDEEATMEIFFDELLEEDAEYDWTVKKEAWADRFREQPGLPDLFRSESFSETTFTTPHEEGPYRVYYSVTNSLGNFASVNIPFYVLNPKNEE